jgi:peroxiredoxin-like protein
MSMQPYPHVYRTTAQGAVTGTVKLESAGLPELVTAAPPEFDGPGGFWSPETLLCAAIADCYVLSFRAVSRAARLDWRQLECQVEGVLERQDGVTRFTRFVTRARLTVPPAADREQARKLLERAEHVCLISNSLQGSRALETEVAVAGSAD